MVISVAIYCYDDENMNMYNFKNALVNTAF